MVDITPLDINLEKFLDKFCPASFPVQGKITMTDANFLNIASLLKIASVISRAGRNK